MKFLGAVKRGLFGAAGVLAVVAIPAFANPDPFYPDSATWSVNTVADGNVTSSFVIGAGGASTLDDDLHAGDAVVVTTGWKIRDDSLIGGGDTAYPKTVTFTASTTIAPVGGTDVAVGSIANCTVTSHNSSCSKNIVFTAPTAPGTYQIKIDTGTGGGPGQLNRRDLVINFTVAEAVVEMIDTKLTVDRQCVLLHAGDVDLTATLEELKSGDKIANADIDFYINPPAAAAGTATTGVDGVATLVHNINDLGAGDHHLYAEFLGDSIHNPSNDSNTLGISYLFQGFGEPIKADGTSIFGGRTIPIKIRLADANGEPVINATPTVWLTSYDAAKGVGKILKMVSSVSAADTGNTMRYAPEDQQYIYNWDASDLANGTYAVVVVLGDSPTCRAENPYAIITVAKKGGKK